MNINRLLHLTPMPEGIRLRLRRFLMDREIDKERRKALRNGGNASDVWEDDKWQFEYQMLEEDEASFHSRELLGRARRLRIPTPPLMDDNTISADYQRSGLDGRRYFLSLVGEQKVRAAIRDEERYRSERWVRRIPYLTALTGLVGTVTGLIALLAKWVS